MTLSSPYQRPILPKIEILPSTDFRDIIWMCPKCKNSNEMRKSDIGENKSYSCWDCGYAWAVGRIPDDIKHFLKAEQVRDIDQRPRIVKW